MFFNQYPYLNLNDLNLDYLLKTIKELTSEVTNFVSINAIKYADPIQWDITSQYEKNTIVIDPVTGTAYISVAPVPAGVALTRPEFWTVVFDLGSFVTKAAQNFTSRWESETTLTATFPSNTNDWLIWGDTLYVALSNIIAGDTYVINSNIRHFTLEDFLGHLNDLNTEHKANLVEAINECLYDAQLNANNIGTLSNLNTEHKDNLVEAINECFYDIIVHAGLIGDLDDLNTEHKANLVEAINECLYDAQLNANNIGTLSDLNTEHKDNLVEAINECLYDTQLNANAISRLPLDLNPFMANRRFLLIGDSYLQGATWHAGDTYTYETKSWGAWFKEMLSLSDDDCQMLGVGGAGFVAYSDQGTWLNRFNAMTIVDATTVTDVLIVGGANDYPNTYSLGDIVTGEMNLISAIKTRCPNANIWVGCVGITRSFLDIENAGKTRQAWSYSTQWGAVYMNDMETTLCRADRLQGDGVHPTDYGNLYIAIAILNNIFGLGNSDRGKVGASLYNGVHMWITYKKGVLFLNSYDDPFIRLSPAMSGTFSGVGGAALQIGLIPNDVYGGATNGSFNIAQATGYAYINSNQDCVPCVFQIYINGQNIIAAPMIIDSGAFYTGSVETFILPNFALALNVDVQ